MSRLARGVPIVALLAIATSSASGAVLCARPRKDGSFNATVKVREACKPAEVQLDPSMVDFCCTETTTTTTTGTTPTSMTCPTSTTATTLPVDDTCASCGPYCHTGDGGLASCAFDQGTGMCTCTGPRHPCTNLGAMQCGGDCPVGSTCGAIFSSDAQCPPVFQGCGCVPSP